MAKTKRAASADPKSRKKLKKEIITEQKEEPPERTVRSEDLSIRKEKWVNRQRVLVLASRRISRRSRHLMLNVRAMLPHSKPDYKVEKERKMDAVLNELTSLAHCNKCIFFDERKGRDLYMWISFCQNGPSAKFLVENVHTMGELKMTGNCLKGSRPILSFSPSFQSEPQYKLLREFFVQVFGTPYHHPKSQPFTDHVFSFSIMDHRIWFRSYQIVEESGSLIEIGPRFTLNPMKIFRGSFCGQTLWTNKRYISPAKRLRMQRLTSNAPSKYLQKMQDRFGRELTAPKESYNLDNLDEVFETDKPFWNEIKKVTPHKNYKEAVKLRRKEKRKRKERKMRPKLKKKQKVKERKQKKQAEFHNNVLSEVKKKFN